MRRFSCRYPKASSAVPARRLIPKVGGDVRTADMTQPACARTPSAASSCSGRCRSSSRRLRAIDRSSGSSGHSSKVSSRSSNSNSSSHGSKAREHRETDDAVVAAAARAADNRLRMDSRRSRELRSSRDLHSRSARRGPHREITPKRRSRIANAGSAGAAVVAAAKVAARSSRRLPRLRQSAARPALRIVSGG